MSFHEKKDPQIIGKDEKPKASEHYRNAIKDKYQETLRTPIREIKILTLEMILEINRQIKEMSIIEPWIQYENKDDPILISKLEKLVEYTQSLGILEIAAYYLKNIILLQVFPDANHRTALTAVKIFLEMNGCDFSHTDEEALSFQEACYDTRLSVYGTCNETSVSVLKENSNGLFSLCLRFIRQHAAIST